MNVRYFQRGPVWWLDVREGPLRKKVTTGKTDKAEAEKVGPELALKTIVALRAATSSPSVDSPSSAPTLKEAFALGMKTRGSWMDSKDKDSLRNTFHVLCDQLGEDLRMDKVDRAFVRECLAKWKEEEGKKRGSKLSNSTINGRLSMLSVLLEVCDLPPHTVKHLTVKHTRRTRRFTDLEIKKMQAWLLANAHRKGALKLHGMITVALDTGARANELETLPHGDIIKDPRLIVLRATKNKQTRRVPYSVASGLVFDSFKDTPGGPFADLNKSQRCALFRDMREGLGLEGDDEAVFHILRHEAASRMIAAGISPGVVQTYMGHSSYNTTQIYVHNSDEALIAAHQQREQFEVLRNAPPTGTVQ